ncbi:MAG TPA: Ig-like domain-containing protein [Candidatus Acidoferrales bacterium]|nr:Ig-like domain-containing protein [Candidatus Acidoferrales bacterium]
MDGAAGGLLTFNPGTAVGWYGLGLALTNGASISFTGLVASPCYFVRCNTVQENDQSGDTSATGITCPDLNASSAVQATFTRFSAAGDLAAFFDASQLYPDYFYNCEFWDGLLGGNVPNGGFGSDVFLVNCLLDRSATAFNTTATSTVWQLTMQNCTLHGGSLYLSQSNPSENASLTVGDSAFDGTEITITNTPNGTADISGVHDAYLTNATKLPHESNDPADQTNFNWQIGQLGNYYLPPGSPLINAGDQSASGIPDSTGYVPKDLSIFTTQTNQMPESAKNPAGNVDIGYHHAAPLQASSFDLQPCVNSAASPQSDSFDFSTQNSGWNRNNPDSWGLLVIYLTNSSPQWGSLTNVNYDNYVYTPSQCYDGPDSFGYQMSDGFFIPTTAMVYVTVADVISASYSPAPAQTPVNTPANITLSGSDSCGQSVSFSWPSTTSQGGTLTGSGSSVTYHPPTSFSGIDGFEFQVVNQCGNSAGAIVFITVGTNSGTGGPFTVVTNLNGGGPIGIDYSPTKNALIVSVDGGDPDFGYDDFVLLSTNTSGGLIVTNSSSVVNLQDEVKVAIVKQGVNGFTNSDVYFGSDTGNGSPGIGWLSADGTSSNLFWCTLTNGVVANSLPLRGGLYVDQTGVFSNDVVAVTSPNTSETGNKGIWSVDARAHSKLVAQINTLHLEGVITLPNSTNQWGPWAGKILTGDEDNNLLYAVDTNGNVTLFSLGIASEDFDIISTNQDLYICDNDSPYKILKLSHTWLTNYVGDLLITQAGDGNFGYTDPRLFIVNWNGTNFVTRSIAGRPYGFSHFEHVSFAPLSLHSQPIQ